MAGRNGEDGPPNEFELASGRAGYRLVQRVALLAEDKVMTVLHFAGGFLWGIGAGLLFLWLVERDARLVVDGRSRWPLTRWLRPLIAALLLFAPASLHGVAIIASLLGFVFSRTLYLARRTRTANARIGS